MNSELTRIIIESHEQGYSEDFVLQDRDLFRCLQTNREYPSYNVHMLLFSQVKDELSNSYKYFYRIEAPNGCRGILLSDKVIFIKPYEPAVRVRRQLL